MVTKNKMKDYENDDYESAYCDWYSEHSDDLIEEFIKDHPAEFTEMLDNVIIDETYDMDYWKDVFCKEEMEQDFYDYCNEAFHDADDARQSDWDDYNSRYR
jgi:hypothetical protein